MTMPDYTIVFDGGSIGNPGHGYGSFAVTAQGQKRPQIHRLSFDGRVTNNEAEYDTLVAALESLLSTARSLDLDPAQVVAEVRGDSQLVIFQVTGRWQAREPRMQQRRERVLALAKQLKHVAFVHQPRAKSVKILGH
jgi:ribonuclease HI